LPDESSKGPYALLSDLKQKMKESSDEMNCEEPVRALIQKLVDESLWRVPSFPQPPVLDVLTGLIARVQKWESIEDTAYLRDLLRLTRLLQKASTPPEGQSSPQVEARVTEAILTQSCDLRVLLALLDLSMSSTKNTYSNS